MTSHVIIDTHLTKAHEWSATVNTGPEPMSRFCPRMVILVPPAFGPRVGRKELTTGF